MQVAITRTTPIYASPKTAGTFVQWDTTDVPANTAVSFVLERSGGPEGPFEEVTRDLEAQHFFDQHVATTTDAEHPYSETSLQRVVYYAVTAIAGDVVARSPAVPVGDNLPRRQMLLRKKIQRDIATAFRVGSGVPWAVLARRHWGPRCTACFDKLTKTVTNTKCTTCYGTGFTGGFFDPVLIYARKGTTNVQVSTAAQGKVEVNQIDFTVLDYPRLSVDDVLVELHQDRRYVVRHVSRTELRGVPVHQKLVLSELSRDSIEYRVPVPSGQAPSFF